MKHEHKGITTRQMAIMIYTIIAGTFAIIYTIYLIITRVF